VNIGIGGSDLGPAFLCQALDPKLTRAASVRLHFVANVDGRQLYDTLAHLNPATTLFIVVSKTFTTIETLQNATTAKAWLTNACPADRLDRLNRHMVAITAKPERAFAFGVGSDRVLGFADWVGGRYSVWGPVGLAVAIASGRPGWESFLAGAHAMDQHFLTAQPASNLPLLMGLAGVWNINFLHCSALAIAPYHQRLARLPAYLQQLEMESLGKAVTASGEPLPYHSSPILFGEPGTNGQHAYFQMLHQGTHVVPSDFLAVLEDDVALPDHHRTLLANCFAQSRAFAFGKTAADPDPDLARHRAFAGNRPSTTLLIDQLTPARLGALVALYEHKVFVQSTFWGINAFDQWGVELGKAMAHEIGSGTVDRSSLDASTRGLMDFAFAHSYS
jgi:glucose-6-phosphate isomerase